MKQMGFLIICMINYTNFGKKKKTKRLITSIIII